jgi:hypothetical protein
MGTLEYNPNNSGGSWWLEDEDWYALEKAGWTVEWVEGGYVGALARGASIKTDFPEATIAEWEEITGQNAKALGCYSCCGPPHSFTFEDGDRYEFYSPSAPDIGEW